MDFYMPVRLFNEENAVWNHRKELAALGKKALLVTGKNSAKRNGAYDDLINALDAEKVDYVLFDQVEENPSIETVMQARGLGVAEKVDFVIAIGGGSPMDAGKSIALMLHHKEKDASYLYEKEGDDMTLPLAVIPTTCGTGSETTPYSILTNMKENKKSSTPHRTWAVCAFLDYRYLMHAPKQVLCDTAMDAFGHMVESYINTNANEFSRMCVTYGLELWSGSKDALAGSRTIEKQDYQNLLTASAMAGMAISVSGTSLPHGFSYGLTCGLGMPHGKAVGYFLAGYMREAEEQDRIFLLKKAGFENVEDFEKYYEMVCGKQEISSQLLLEIAEGILSNQAKLKNCPYQVDMEKVKRMVGLA